MQIYPTPLIKVILASTFATFIIQQTCDQFFGTQLVAWFGLVPYSFMNQYLVWQLFTYPWIHLSLMHLFFNLLMIAWIGSIFHRAWGQAQFLKFYFFCIISTGLAYLILSGIFPGTSGLHIPLVGMDGIIYGFLMAYAIFHGEENLFFMMMFPMKAKHFVIVIAGVELLSQVYSHGNLIATLANVSTLGSAYLYLLIKRNNNGKRKSLKKIFHLKNKKQSHLKVVPLSSFDESAQDLPKNPSFWH